MKYVGSLALVATLFMSGASLVAQQVADDVAPESATELGGCD